MTFIPMVPEDRATEDLSRIYRRVSDPHGRVDHILKIHSLNPPSLEHHYDLYAHLMRGPSPLTRLQREMIAVVVSAANDCFY
jgi:alkylhydroperoxidase family enzyme